MKYTSLGVHIAHAPNFKLSLQSFKSKEVAEWKRLKQNDVPNVFGRLYCVC